MSQLSATDPLEGFLAMRSQCVAATLDDKWERTRSFIPTAEHNIMVVQHEPEQQSAGDEIPPSCVQIEVHVAELKMLFNAIDPSPFRERDLDPKAEEFIVGWAKEAPRDRPLAMLVHLDRTAGLPDEAKALRDSVHEFFKQRAQVARRRLRELFRRGRISLLIGLVTLGAMMLLGDLIGSLTATHTGELLRESLLIGGWVAMWRPLEVFLYDWWPIRAEARLYDRLSAMPVRIAYEGQAKPQAWRTDWPAVPPAERTTP